MRITVACAAAAAVLVLAPAGARAEPWWKRLFGG